MHKGIYFDSNTKSWFIHTKKNNKNITIRGYASKKEADLDYDFAIEKWFKEHNIIGVSSYSSVVNEYLDYRSKLVRKESLRKDKTQFKYFNPIFQSDTINSIFEQVRLNVIYDNIVGNEIFSHSKKNQLIQTFREFSKYCYMTNRIDKKTFDSVLIVFLPIKVAKQDTKDKRYIPISHFKAISSVVIEDNDNLFNLALFVLYFGGLRISELLGLYESDVDLENRKINIRRQLLTNGEITTTLKTNNSYRQIPINNELYSFLQKKCRNLSQRLFDMSHTTFKRKLAYYEKKANVPNYSAHEFRHSFCTNLASKITNISEVSYCAKISGHTNSIFLNTYVKSMESELESKFF